MPKEDSILTHTQKTKQLLLRASSGFIKHSAEMALYTLLFPIEMLGSPSRHPREIYRSADRAADLAHALLNPDDSSFISDDDAQLLADELARRRFKRRFYYLRKKGLIQTVSDKVSEYRLTRAGRERLAQIFPTYLSSRPWDGKIYLITYDISEERSKDRDLLRERLRRLGCAMFQYSVWVSAYDPRKILRAWAQERNLTGSVVVSDVGEDGSIAGQTIPELIQKLYDLGTVDAGYRDFIQQYQHTSDPTEVDQWQLNLDWSTCVERDPQLPFELLPKNFSGNQAFQIYQKLATANLIEAFKDIQTTPWQTNEQKYLRQQRKTSSAQS